MAWRELAIRARGDDVERLSGGLFGLGAAGVQEDWLPGEAPPARQPWDTGPPPPEPAGRLVRAWFEGADEEAVTRAVADLGYDGAWSDVPDVDWEAESRAAFPPLPISPRLVVAAPWDAPPGALIVEPGQGFGTGQHPTTRQALRALDGLADGCATAIDVGCGSGVLALAAAKLGLRAVGIDVDEPSIADARRNAALNGLDVPFSTTPVEGLTEPADLVLANLFAEVLVEMAPHLDRLTRKHLVLAGILAEREGKVRAAFDHLALEGRDQDGEWVSLVYAGRS